MIDCEFVYCVLFECECVCFKNLSVKFNIKLIKNFNYTETNGEIKYNHIIIVFGLINI